MDLSASQMRNESDKTFYNDMIYSSAVTHTLPKKCQVLLQKLIGNKDKTARKMIMNGLFVLITYLFDWAFLPLL